MAGLLPGYPSHCSLGVESIAPCKLLQEEPQSLRRWYFSKEEIVNCSPSRKDAINYETESGLRKLYCSFLQELGIELKVPQVTIATAMILCHQFYMRQSHAKNHWQIIATVCMFLACKAEETPRWLADLVVVSYKLIYKWDPSAPQRIKKKEVYDKQKQLIVDGERLLLTTIAYELNIEHPYKPLVAAIKRLEISHKDIAKVAWNFVNDWLRSTLCLQYKPHYIAAGSLFLAAKFLKVKLPTEKGKSWWMQFDVSPKKLEDVIQQMLQYLEHHNQRQEPSKCRKSTESRPAIAKAMSSNTGSCISSISAVDRASSSSTMRETSGALKSASTENGNMHSRSVCDSVEKSHQNQAVPSKSVISENSNAQSSVGFGSVKENNQKKEMSNFGGSSQAEPAIGQAVSHGKESCILSSAECTNEKEHLDSSDCGSANSVVEDGGSEPMTEQSEQKPCEIVSAEDPKCKIDILRIKETLKKRKLNNSMSKKVDSHNEIDSEEWIEIDSEPMMEQSKQKTCEIVSAQDPKRKIDILRIKETLKRRKLNNSMSKKVDSHNEIDSEEWIERELENLE